MLFLAWSPGRKAAAMTAALAWAQRGFSQHRSWEADTGRFFTAPLAALPQGIKKPPRGSFVGFRENKTC